MIGGHRQADCSNSVLANLEVIRAGNYSGADTGRKKEHCSRSLRRFSVITPSSYAGDANAEPRRQKERPSNGE
jgi:hypothetical protein